MTLEGLNRMEVYKVSQELAAFIYQQVLLVLPPEEKYGLTSQIRRAAASVPANIAEGYGRYYYQETIRFCYLARGSLMELSSHFDLAHAQGYISNEINEKLDVMMNSVLRLIHGYIKYLKQSKRGWNEPGASSISEAIVGYSLSTEDTTEVSS